MGAPTQSPLPNEGTPIVIAEAPRTAEVPVSVDSGDTISRELQGQNGDTAFLFHSGPLTQVPFGVAEGFLQIVGIGRRRLGTVGPSGHLTVPLDMPGAAPGLVRSLTLQVVFRTAQGELRMTPASVIDVRGAGTPVW